MNSPSSERLLEQLYGSRLYSKLPNLPDLPTLSTVPTRANLEAFHASIKQQMNELTCAELERRFKANIEAAIAPLDDNNPQGADAGVSSLPKRGINWQNAIVLSSCHMISALTIRYITRRDLIFAIITYIIFCLSTTMGLHRLWTHTSYETTKPIKYVMMVINCGTMMNSIENWCSDHRMHHMFEDSHPEYDPYSITEGFFNAHVGAIMKERQQYFHDKQSEIIKAMYANEWRQDASMIKWQQKFYMPLMLVMTFIVPISFSVSILETGALSAIGSCFLRILLVWHCTWLVNSLAHWAGARPFTEGHTSAENWIVSLLAMGEGYHNYHHSFPKDYRASRDFRGLNLTAWILEGMRWSGLVWDCKYVADEDQFANPGRSIDFPRIRYSVASPSLKTKEF